MARIDDILNQMTDREASDLHITSGCAPYLRVHGEMVKLNYKDLSPEVSQALIFEVLTETQRERFTETCDLDCSYSLKGVGRFRVNVFRQRNGVGAVFRARERNSGKLIALKVTPEVNNTPIGQRKKWQTRKPVEATDDEVNRNPRARSAKLRAARRKKSVSFGIAPGQPPSM